MICLYYYHIPSTEWKQATWNQKHYTPGRAKNRKTDSIILLVVERRGEKRIMSEKVAKI